MKTCFQAKAGKGKKEKTEAGKISIVIGFLLYIFLF